MASGSTPAVPDSDDDVEVAKVLDSDDDVEVGVSKSKTGLMSIGHGLSHGSRPLHASLAKPVEPLPDSQCPDDLQLSESPPQAFPRFVDHMHSPRRPALKRSNLFEGTPEGMESSQKGDQQSVDALPKELPGYDSDTTLELPGYDVAVERGAAEPNAVERDDKDETVTMSEVEVEVEDDNGHHDKPSDADMMDLLQDPKFKKGTRMKDLSPNSQEMLKKVRKARNVQNSSAWHSKYVSKGVRKSSSAAGSDGVAEPGHADHAGVAEGGHGDHAGVAEGVHGDHAGVAEPDHADHAGVAAPYKPLTLKNARATWLQYPF